MINRAVICWALFIAFLTVACGAPAVQPVSAPVDIQEVAPPLALPQATPAPVDVAGAAEAAAVAEQPAGRQALLSELLNEVLARTSEAVLFEQAAAGQVIGLGGQVRTGVDSRVRIDLTEGTIVRLAPQSEFTVTEFNDNPSNPFTRLALSAGKLWVILQGGSLEVKTPVGVATVRGSYLSVDFYPEYEVLVVTCLEGHCELKNDAGAAELTNGQAASISGENMAPSDVRPMTEDEYQEWQADNPESAEFIPESMLTPEATPDDTPAGGSGGTSVGEVERTQPLNYSIANACQIEGAGKVTFEGPVTVAVHIPLGETRSGALPPGIYNLTVTLEIGATFGPYRVDSDEGLVTFSLCGDENENPPAGGSEAFNSDEPLRYTFTNDCPPAAGTAHVTFVGPETRTVDIPTGETVSGELPPGTYTASLKLDDGHTGGPQTLPPNAWPLVRGICDDGPPPGENGNPPPGGDHVNTRPLRYTLTNRCRFIAPDGTIKIIGWHWKFEGPETRIVDVPAGQTVSGELPPGRYTVTDWNDEGFTHNSGTLDSDFVEINVTHCPDQ
jgi:hypothetical protein